MPANIEFQHLAAVVVVQRLHAIRCYIIYVMYGNASTGHTAVVLHHVVRISRSPFCEWNAMRKVCVGYLANWCRVVRVMWTWYIAPRCSGSYFSQFWPSYASAAAFGPVSGRPFVADRSIQGLGLLSASQPAGRWWR